MERYGGDDGLSDSSRVRYLEEYLQKLDAKTMIVEHEYVDRNFIDDYCGYYGRCFRDYPKKCERLHFFSTEFDNTNLCKAVLDKDSKEKRDICDNYLGFIVMRPIPGARIGRLCLSTYPTEEGKNRRFPVLKKYKAHFMGLSLEVDSVAFQEQDKIISACATSALWSAFHSVGDIRTEDVHSPFLITKNARKVTLEPISYNVMDKGLFPSQMAAAITDEGLSPLLSGVVSKSYLKALTRAYLNVGLPLIWGMSLEYEVEDRNSVGKTGSALIGEHAVTVVGYRVSENELPQFSCDRFAGVNSDEQPLYLLSSSIDKFYVHDDQVGPFASMDDRNEYWQRLETRWNYYEDPADKVDATVNTVIIPAYKKIRIRFPIIFNFITHCNLIFSGFLDSIKKKLIWDARIFCINDLKNRVADNDMYQLTDPDLKLKLLSEKLPRFVWVMDAYLNDNVLGEDGLKISDIEDELMVSYLLDATDMESGDSLICGIHHSDDAFAIFHQILSAWNENDVNDFIGNLSMNKIVMRSLIAGYRDKDTSRLWVPSGASLDLN